MYTVIIPVYNEQQVIHQTYSRLKAVMDAVGEPYELLFVDDGSRDATNMILRVVIEKDPNVRLVEFSRNFGHQVAISAGMDHASGDAIVVIDADLQDPPEVIPLMIGQWKQGFEVVYGKRIRREGETLFKKLTAKVFYRFLRRMTDVDIPVDSGDFRLIDRRVRDVFLTLTEKNRYVRGLISWVGFRQTAVEYVREERFAGVTKYPFARMLRFAMDGVTSFSYKPLRLASYFGFGLSLLSFIYLAVVVLQRLFTETTISGWASTVAISLFFNGMILFFLGVMGEYVGRIYEEVKNRPLYIVREKVGFPPREQ